MTQPILADAEMRTLVSGNPSTLGLSIARLKDFIRQVEKAVVAKLAEQEPITEIDCFGDTCCPVFGDRLQLKRGTKLYAHPVPSSQGFLDNSNHIPDGSKLVGLSLSVDTKETQALLQSYLDGLDGWQLVPVMPTDAMLKKIFPEIFDMDGVSKSDLIDRYQAMLAATPRCL